MLASSRLGQSNKLPNLVIHHIQLILQLHSQSPGISSNDAIPLSAKSNSGFWISFASSIIFLVFNIFAFGIHETCACSMTARAAVQERLFQYARSIVQEGWSQHVQYQKHSLGGRTKAPRGEQPLPQITSNETSVDYSTISGVILRHGSPPPPLFRPHRLAYCY